MTTPATTLTPGPAMGSGVGAAPGSSSWAPGSAAALAEARIRRLGPDGYDAWERHVATASGCTRPVRLRGSAVTVDTRTGEVIDTYESTTAPDGVIYKACGTRRASVCPACAETYRVDAYMLIRAGISGSDSAGVPASVAAHPLMFLTLTAPGFGLVHGVRTRGGKALPCRARRDRPFCRHGRPSWCTSRHRPGEPCLGQPLCPDCYDYPAHVVWNHHASELWRRTTIALRRSVERLGDEHGVKLKVSFGKVAEYQARGVVHFHALIRLDAVNAQGELVPPPARLTGEQLAQLAAAAAQSTSWWTPPHPDSPDGVGWRMTWGTQIDSRPVRDGQAAGQLEEGGPVQDLDVASYLAKYATKATEAVGLLAHRLTASTVGRYADESHTGRLIAACWRLGDPSRLDPPDEDGRRPYDRIRAWAHMLGFGGHFLTKSRRYSTTFGERRKKRTDYRRRHHLQRLREQLGDQLDRHQAGDAAEETTLVIGNWTYTGNGWLTTGDQLLAIAIAADTRERKAIAREEARTA